MMAMRPLKEIRVMMITVFLAVILIPAAFRKNKITVIKIIDNKKLVIILSLKGGIFFAKKI